MALRLEGLLRQLEYQAGLAAARGGRPIDTHWLRTELGLTSGMYRPGRGSHGTGPRLGKEPANATAQPVDDHPSC